MRPRLLIADHAAAGAAIRRIVLDDADICAEVCTSEQAIHAAGRDQPDLCLVGREIDGDWLGAVRGISGAAPACAIIVLAEVGDVDDLLVAVRTGAVGYVLGPVDARRLRGIFAAVSANEAVIPSSMVLDLLVELRTGGDGLTTRESQVLRMLNRGHTTAAIAERLAITPVTVRRHISELVHKLGVEDRAALLGQQSSRQSLLRCR